MKPNTAIQITNLSKKYIISHHKTAYNTLRDSFVSFWKNLFTQKKKEEFLALKNINLEITQGSILGVIGKNGAGKSTLLKILSRIVEPTNGEIKIRGKVASLLEVGTGFNPELTGRENIYLNGSILGMTRKEINAKFSDIVKFSEIEKFLDTPVKRYSSGMYVRLAFAVAAHLDSDILLVDEVLAVGDIAFQKKSLGKMNKLAKDGRTVIFVSHNMGAIQDLCDQCLFLENGEIKAIGKTDKVIKQYLNNKKNINLNSSDFKGTLKELIKIKEIVINDNKNKEEVILSPKEELEIKITFSIFENFDKFRLTLSIFQNSIRILTLHDCLNFQKV
ncbi:ABC transporter ATP-binding protein [Candidatus Beckwithbacteria bacterium]|nr:ABC transporter ATP-binding protein [Candidatus Beckwithbacteria bacterium]